MTEGARLNPVNPKETLPIHFDPASKKERPGKNKPENSPETPFIIQDIDTFHKDNENYNTWIPQEFLSEENPEKKRVLLTAFIRAFAKAETRRLEGIKARGKILDPQTFVEQQVARAQEMDEDGILTDIARSKLESFERAKELAAAKLAAHEAGEAFQREREQLIQEQKATAAQLSEAKTQLDLAQSPLTANDTEKTRALEATVAELQKKLQETEQKIGRSALTGLLNAQGIEPIFRKERERSERSGESGIMVMVRFDADNFKTINDTHGHFTGDRILQAVGQALEKTTRPGDYALHFSGDEFGLLLTNVKPAEGKNIEETVRAIIQRQIEEVEKIQRPDGEYQTISAGFRIISAQEDAGFGDFSSDADNAAYTAKHLKYDLQDGKRVHRKGSTRVIDFGEVEKVLAGVDKGKYLTDAFLDKSSRSFSDIIAELEQKQESGVITEEEIQQLKEAQKEFVERMVAMLNRQTSAPPQVQPPVPDDDSVRF